jgi:DNA end-binding protein Ku
MIDQGRVGIGTVVMRNKQYLAAIRPLDGALAMSTMRFADEVVARKDVDGVPSRRSKPEAKALKLATQIIDSLAGEWKPEQYHDTYTEELRSRIKAKDEGKEVVEEPTAEPRTNVVDLMEALEASVQAAKGARGSRARTRKPAKAAKAAKAAKPAKATKRARKSA